MRRLLSSGLTLIEMMVVIALVGVLLALAAPSVHDFILLQRLKGIHSQFLTDIQFARGESVARRTAVWVRVQNDATTKATCYTIYATPQVPASDSEAGQACNCLRSPVCVQAVSTGPVEELRTVQLPPERKVSLFIPVFSGLGTVGRFQFEPGTASVSYPYSDRVGVSRPPTLSFDTSIDCRRTLRVEVNVSGRASSCSPQGTRLGEPACTNPLPRTGCTA